MTTQRTDWIDYAKGIGIILVVYAHLLSSGFHAGLPISQYFFSLSDSGVYSFHMPLFFFLAGLFVKQSLNKRGVWKYCLEKFQYLAYPYLLWSIIQGVVELLFAKHSHRGLDVFDLLRIPYFPLAQFWFLYAILIMYLAFALASYLNKFSFAVMLTVALILFFRPISTEIMALHGFSTGFLYFVFGIILREYWKQLDLFTIPGTIIFVLFLLFLTSTYIVFEYLIEPTRLTDGSNPIYFLYLSSLGIFVCIGLAQILAAMNRFAIIKTFGLFSIQIYLVHMLAGVAVRVVLLALFNIENPLIHMVLGVCGGIFIPIALYKISKKVHFPYLFEIKRLQRIEK